MTGLARISNGGLNKRLIEDIEEDAKEKEFVDFMTNPDREQQREGMRKAEKSFNHDACNISDLFHDDLSRTEGVDFLWSMTYPLSFFKCRRIAQLARHMPKAEVMDKVFVGGYAFLSDEEKDFADRIFNYGRALGLSVVTKQLYDGAAEGDPRAVKMYLEMLKIIGTKEEGGNQLDNLLKVDLDIAVTG